ncbi:MAG: hypothetical protein K5930_10755 [Treponemataceae bacterium]|nr:hypothetical protein [Treponemataceae bacterium]
MLRFLRNREQSGQALKKKLAGLFFFSASSFIIITLMFLSSCGRKKTDSSFSEQLGLIDACIQNNQFQDAVTLTDKAAEDAVGLEKQLSIVKRYSKLGELGKNKLFVEAALKKQPELPELNAVYVNILLAEGNILEAVKHTDLLADTKWSPLYTEVILRQAVADSIFMGGDYTDFFVRAAGATQNQQWLVDAAVVEASRGNFHKAASITPASPMTEKDAYFWALINYDAGNYLECVDLCNKCTSIPEAVLLASDAWLLSGENKTADGFWLSVINSGKKSIPKEIYYNAALYAIRTDDLEAAFQILVDMIAAYPDYDEGLALYADYALRTSGSMITEPSSVLSTLQELKRYSVPAVPVSDALYNMETSLSKNFRSPLYVEFLRTKWLSGDASSLSCRQDILLALEKYSSDNEKDSYLTDFAVCWMLRNYYENEACGLFYDYMSSKYDFGAAAFAENAALLDDRECMLAAWFRLDDGFIDDAKKLYETYIFDRNCINDFYAAMNLGAIYYVTGAFSKALDLYGTLAGATQDSILASEVHYRMGYIQASRNDKKNALLSLSYSVKLNPDNNKARLLLKTLQ